MTAVKSYRDHPPQDSWAGLSVAAEFSRCVAPSLVFSIYIPRSTFSKIPLRLGAHTHLAAGDGGSIHAFSWSRLCVSSGFEV